MGVRNFVTDCLKKKIKYGDFDAGNTSKRIFVKIFIN